MLDELGITDPEIVNSPSHLAQSANAYTRVSVGLDIIAKKRKSYLSKTYYILTLINGFPFPL